MHCMKCGKDTGGSQVFCGDCLAEMEKYPVKPGTTVYIPSRSRAVHKNQRHPAPIEPEEQLRRMQGKVRWLSAGLLVTLLALAASAVLIVYLYRQPDNPFTTGQDYSVSDTNNPANGTSAVGN